MQHNNKIIFLYIFLYAIEIIFLIIYIIQVNKSYQNNNNNIIDQMINNLENPNLDINKYFYLLEFKRLLQYNKGGKSYERNIFLEICTYFYIPIFVLLFFAMCFLWNEAYKGSIIVFSICAFISFFAFVESLIYPYKVDMPGKEIYIFNEEFNDKINDILSDKLNIKIYTVLSTSIILMVFILLIILGSFLLKNKTKEKLDDSILSPIINVNNEKDPILN